MERIIEIMCCPLCKGELTLNGSVVTCERCGKIFPIINDIPRFVSEEFYSLQDEKSKSIEEKTKNYFGFEWEYFDSWGFIPDDKVLDKHLYHGGTVSDRKKAFDSKCRLSEKDLRPGDIVLDAGCGNGRYTYEASLRTKNIVIGIDIGYGSVESAYKNCKERDNVIIMQASLFALPFKNNVINFCFSNGVLMHTGNARLAFDEIARTIAHKGIFVAHVYHKLNPIWELNDWFLRQVTTRMSIEGNIRFARFMAWAAKKCSFNKKFLAFINLFFRFQPTVIHMYDWYAAPYASHHTYEELASWFLQNDFEILDELPQKRLWRKPWAANLMGRKK